MKLIVRLLVCSVLLITVDQDALAQSQSQFLPAMLGHHKQSLINTIDTQVIGEARARRWLRDVRLHASTQRGNGDWSRTYRCSPNTELLQKEVLGRIDRAMFEPAVIQR